MIYKKIVFAGLLLCVPWLLGQGCPLVLPNDQCPNDPNKMSPGVCGCGTPDVDTDQDGAPDCNDGCPQDPNKTNAGVCGCGVSDTDGDQDGAPDCNDGCPNDPQKTAPGNCGCGIPEIPACGTSVTIRVINEAGTGITETLTLEIDGALTVITCTSTQHVCESVLPTCPQQVLAISERRTDTTGAFRGGRNFNGSDESFNFTEGEFSCGQVITYMFTATSASAYVY